MVGEILLTSGMVIMMMMALRKSEATILYVLSPYELPPSKICVIFFSIIG